MRAGSGKRQSSLYQTVSRTRAVDANQAVSSGRGLQRSAIGSLQRRTREPCRLRQHSNIAQTLAHSMQLREGSPIWLVRTSCKAGADSRGAHSARERQHTLGIENAGKSLLEYAAAAVVSASHTAPA